MPKIELTLPRLAALIPMLLWSLDIMSSGKVLPIGYITAVMVLMLVLLWTPGAGKLPPPPPPAREEPIVRTTLGDAGRLPDGPRARRGM